MSDRDRDSLATGILLGFFAVVIVISLIMVDMVNGSELYALERIEDLPNDQDKWYLSVVGDIDDMRYSRIVFWFASNKKLRGLSDQVHYRRVTTDTVLYEERYAQNTKKVPMVRLQKADGTVVYEACAREIPVTPAGLYSAIARAVNGPVLTWPWVKAEQVLPLLPWRRNMEQRRCTPPVGPPFDVPPVMPPPFDYEPQPLDSVGPPVLEEEESGVALGPVITAVLIALCASVGAGAGFVQQYKLESG